MAADAFGVPVLFMLTGREAHDGKATPVLIETLPQSKYVIADIGIWLKMYFRVLNISVQLRRDMTN